MSARLDMGASAPEAVLEDLSSKLDVLPTEKFLAVFKQLQAISALPGIGHIIDEARPRLRVLKPFRIPALKRLMCNPFEDLLCGVDAWQPSASSNQPAGTYGRISRNAIEPFWKVLSDHDGAKLKTLETELKSASTPEHILMIGRRIWTLAADCLAELLDPKSSRDVVPPELVRSYGIMQSVLQVADTVEAFKVQILERPIKRLGETERGAVLNACVILREQKLFCDGFMLVAAARLDSPGEILGLLDRSDIAISAVLRRELSMVAAQDVDERSDRFEKQAESASPGDIARNAETLMLSLSVTREFLNAKDRAGFDARMSHIAGTVRNTLSARVIGPAAEMMSAVMTRDGVAPSKEQLISAEEQARALRRSRKVAALVGVEQDVRSTTLAICRKFENRIDQLLTGDIKNNNTPEAKAAKSEVYRSIRMVELVDGPQQAQRLLAEAKHRM